MQREMQRTIKGVTIKEVRAEAGRKGGLAKAQKILATDGRLLEFANDAASKTLANGATPSTQHPAPNTINTNPPTPPAGGSGLELPFESDEFKSAWNDWTQHRKEIRHALKPTTVKQQFKKFVAMGEARSIAAIRYSIEQGYQGLVEPSANGRGTPIPQRQTAREIVEEIARNREERKANELV
jgi:hypothetical protein